MADFIGLLELRFKTFLIAIAVFFLAEYDQEIPQLQTNPRHHEDEPHNNNNHQQEGN